MVIRGGTRDDWLIGVESDAAARAELHRSIEDQGIMQMRQVEAVAVAAGGTVRLSPGGYHVMLRSLARDLQPGDAFAVTLLFQTAGRIDATATVRTSDPADPAVGMSMPTDQPEQR